MEDISRRQFMGTLGLTGAVLALGLAGCGSSSSSSSSGSGSSSSSDSKIQTIKDRGQLNAGVKKDVVGFGLLDTATGKYQGMEIDLCYQVAAKIFDVSYDDAKSKDLVAFTDVTPKTRGPLIDNDPRHHLCYLHDHRRAQRELGFHRPILYRLHRRFDQEVLRHEHDGRPRW